MNPNEDAPIDPVTPDELETETPAEESAEPETPAVDEPEATEPT